jgi:hypothetical protein
MPNYYDDAPEVGNDQMPPKPDGGDMQDQEGSPQTAVINKDFFGSKELKVGNTCEVRIDRIMDKEVAVSYVPHDENEGKEPDSGESSGTPEPMPAGRPGMYD